MNNFPFEWGEVNKTVEGVKDNFVFAWKGHFIIKQVRNNLLINSS